MEYQKNKYYEIAIVSDIGERKENEDAYGIDVSEENAAVVVCDGMGGFESGKLASGTAVNELIRLYRQRINQKKLMKIFLYMQWIQLILEFPIYITKTERKCMQEVPV